jgi:hypothetical protein
MMDMAKLWGSSLLRAAFPLVSAYKISAFNQSAHFNLTKDRHDLFTKQQLV